MYFRNIEIVRLKAALLIKIIFKNLYTLYAMLSKIYSFIFLIGNIDLKLQFDKLRPAFTSFDNFV